MSKKIYFTENTHTQTRDDEKKPLKFKVETCPQ